MKKSILAAFSILCLLTLLSGIIPALGCDLRPINLSFQLTTDAHYDRNPSLFQSNDGTWWLFFTRGLSSTGVRDQNGYVPDLDAYDIYCKRAQSLLGLQTAAEFKVPGSDPNHGQRDVTALQTRDGRIWVFSSTGFGPGDNHIYCFTYYRGTWQGPTAISIQEDKWIGHINALEYQGKIWLFYDAEYSLKSAYYDGTWHGPYNIATEATLGKAIVDNGKFYIAWAYVDPVQNIWGSYIGLSSSTNGKNWVNHGPIASWPEPEATNWDPVLIKDRCYFKLIWAPDAGTKGQFIATSKSTNPTDPTSWSTPTKLTVASHGTENWWDFWPQPIRMGNGALNSIFLVYASERSKDGTNRIDSNIWLRMTLDL